MSLTQAFLWNLGTRTVMKTEKAQAIKSEAESRDVQHWGGLTRSSDEVLVMRMEPRG
jgi:hypothetical protein